MEKNRKGVRIPSPIPHTSHHPYITPFPSPHSHPHPSLVISLNMQLEGLTGPPRSHILLGPLIIGRGGAGLTGAERRGAG